MQRQVFVYLFVLVFFVYFIPYECQAFRIHTITDNGNLEEVSPEVIHPNDTCKLKNTTIRYWIDRSTVPISLTVDDVREAIQMAIKPWQDINRLSKYIEFIEVNQEPQEKNKNNDGIVVISWESSPNNTNKKDFAVASIGCFAESLEWSDGIDIYMNNHSGLIWTIDDSEPESSTTAAYLSTYLPGVLVHEFGHVLGLGHSENRNATMRAGSSLFGLSFKDQTKLLNLDEDDIEGIQFLYGKTCHSIKFLDELPAGFGAPYSTQTSEHELLIQAECENDQAFITVGNSSSSLLTYVWPTIHYWYNNQRIETELTCTEQVSGWCRSSGVTTIDLNPDETWLIGYVCQWDGNRWRCGCRDETCDPQSGTGGLWLAQRIQR